MRRKVLVSAPHMQPLPEKYRTLLEDNDVEVILPEVEQFLSESDLLELIGDIDGVISGDDQFTARVFDAAPRLRVVSKWGTGIDSIDTEAARKRGISIRNTPNAFTDPVADSVMGYVLCFARKLPWMNDHMKAGSWTRLPGRSLSECTLGIIGVGNIGKACVRRALAFKMRVLGNDIVDMPSSFLEETRISMVSKEELLRQADFVSLNCDLNPTSYRIMGAKEFAHMKPSSFLINLARGPLVHERELVAALEKKRLAGAALDVFEAEPLPMRSPLRNFDSVLLAPHNANTSPSSWEQTHQSTVNNLLEELER